VLHTDFLYLTELFTLEDPNGYIPIALLVASWIGMTLREDVDSLYFEKKENSLRTRFFLFFSVFLAMLTIVIIYKQTATLGMMSYPISIISGLLIVLIGSLLLEEQ
jgi:hypothetical protein